MIELHSAYESASLVYTTARMRCVIVTPRWGVSAKPLLVMMSRRLFLVGLSVLFGLGCEGQTIQSQPPLARADSAFAHLVADLSEAGGYFDTDNLISNETSYLHVMGTLQALDVQGGAYIGVGPDQNFSYITQIRPEIAFMVDVRRDNLLQHLFFKALFAAAPNRIAYVGLMIGKPVPPESEAWTERSLEDLIAYLDNTESRPVDRDRARAIVRAQVRHTGIRLNAADLKTIEAIHDAFIQSGLSLRFTSHGRAPRAHYPTYRRLLLETDGAGQRANYLAHEDDFQFLKRMHAEDRIVPVVGDLAGPHAIQAIGTWLRARDLQVSAFYTSNVEFYLMGHGTFGRFARNVEALPWYDNGILIRSYFNYFRAPLAQTKAGHGSTQLLQTAASFLETQAAGGYRNYRDLVTRDVLPLQ